MKKTQLKTLCFILLSSLFIAGACSSDDDGTPDQPPFEEVVISLEALNVELEDMSFNVGNYNFTSFRALSFDDGFFDGVQIANPIDLNNPSYIELNLSQVSGISTISVTLLNGTGDTSIAILNDGMVVQEIDGVGGIDIGIGVTTATLDVSDNTFDTLMISSLEASVGEIILQ
ncbi:MAG: hypothetical protein AAFX55_20075 [Bacteroidota bacterium]